MITYLSVNIIGFTSPTLLVNRIDVSVELRTRMISASTLLLIERHLIYLTLLKRVGVNRIGRPLTIDSE